MFPGRAVRRLIAMWFVRGRPWWAVALLLSCTIVSAQGRPAIDVAAIRENRGPRNDFSKRATVRPGRLDLFNMTVEDLVARAYGIRAFRMRDRLIVGWPETGIKDARFDVQATLLNAAGPLSVADQNRLFLDLLATRFGFAAHIERRPVAVYRLTLAKPGTLGRGLTRVAFNCAELSAAQAPKDKEGRSLCRQGGTLLPGAVVHLHGSGPISDLIFQLQGIPTAQAERLIVDGTGLTGFFVWDLQYGGTLGAFSTLVREQLGLKLEPATAPVAVVVIDRVQMPTPN